MIDHMIPSFLLSALLGVIVASLMCLCIGAGVFVVTFLVKEVARLIRKDTEMPTETPTGNFVSLLQAVERLAKARMSVDSLREALDQLLKEVLAAGFGTANYYNWPKVISDAKKALAKAGELV
jgi:hypothetical protein